MIGFNLSVDFELGWGDLARITEDDEFRRRAIDGTERTLEVVDVLERGRVPSTWAVVGGCCCTSLDELQRRAPRPFAAVQPQLERLQRSRRDYERILFCPSVVQALAQRDLIEVGSHGFLHLIPAGLDTAVLQEDVAASVKLLQESYGRRVLSFVPPQNYFWPREAFAQTPIRYVRHSPIVYGRPYSARGLVVKLLRMGNDVLRPTRHPIRSGEHAALVFLRIDRGSGMWRVQLKTLRDAFRRMTGTVYCFTHPHNFHSSAAVRRLAELCDLVQEYRERRALEFRPFARDLGLETNASVH